MLRLYTLSVNLTCCLARDKSPLGLLESCLVRTLGDNLGVALGWIEILILGQLHATRPVQDPTISVGAFNRAALLARLLLIYK